VGRLTHEEPQGQAIDPKTLEALSSKKEQVREQARQVVDHAGVDALLATVRAEGERRAKRRKVGIGILCFYALLLVIMVATDHGKSMGSFGGMTGVLATLFAASQAQRNAAKELAKYDDVRGVGPLTEALDYQDKETTAAVEPTLVDLLPRLKASDHDLLEEAHRKALTKRMLAHKNPKLTSAILRGFEQVADEVAVKAIREVAAGEHKAGTDAAIRKLAAEILPGAEAAAVRLTQYGTLLRPADASALGDRLVRPAAAGVFATDADRLVRAAEAPGDEGVNG
jgi:hypothetical protein